MDNSTNAQKLAAPDLRQMNARMMQVYRALFDAQDYLSESAQLAEQCDALLRTAGYAFLQPPLPSPAPRQGNAVEGMIASAAQVHKSYAAILATLRRLALALANDRKWQTAQPLLHALHELEPHDRQIEALHERSVPFAAAQVALDAGNWEAARKCIKPWLKQNENDEDTEALMYATYLLPVQQAMQSNNWRAVRKVVESLNTNTELINSEYLANEIRQAQQRCMLKQLDFVKVPSGVFQYSENNEEIFLGDYMISRMPVTNAQYQMFVHATGHMAPFHWIDDMAPPGKENHPVTNVSQANAHQFCRWAGVQLPSERQWEKAARGTDGRVYPWGNQRPDSERCNFNNCVGATTPVDQYPLGASPYGVLDMAGNVSEWCDGILEIARRATYHLSHSGSLASVLPANFHASSQFGSWAGLPAVLRGGAFYLNEDNVRCTVHTMINSGFGHSDIGFRVITFDT